jgi:hypothetical protein
MGEMQFARGDAGGALKHFQESHGLLLRLVEKDKTDEEGRWFLANADYCLAVAQLAAGDRAAALGAIENGYADLWMLQHAPELESIRGLPGYQESLEKLSKKSIATARMER